VGIANTRARLKYLYGTDASFDFEILGGNVAVARLVVPAFTRDLAHAANA
jgi:sensor histidine kinase YesM